MSAITLTAQLVRDARLATHPDGHAWLLLELAQCDGTPGAVARWHLGQGHAAQYAAANAARRYLRGTRVTVYASTWDVLLHPEAHLVLLGVERVLAEQLPAPRGQCPQELAA